MNVLVISSNYPSLQNPNYGAFVYNLMQELAKEHKITVISPFKRHELNKSKSATYGTEACDVKRPVFLSLSNKKIGFVNTGKLSHYFYKKAVRKSLMELKQKPDIIYVHFLSNAISVLDYAKKHNIPIVVASGESTYTSFEKRDTEIKNKLIENINHIICVSTENRNQLVDLGFDSKKLSVIPNAVNYAVFKPLDKSECKEKLGLQSDKFTVGFIGHFIHRKGPNRIIEAIEKLNDSDIHLVCVGSRGELKPNNFTTIIPPVPNVKLPEIYNAFDVFVLPTLHEGSCNVIEEAKACCLPIISSKGTSVEEQIVDNQTGILIDPMNIDSIALGIKKTQEDKDFRSFLEGNLKNKIGENSLSNRAQRISSILKTILEK